METKLASIVLSSAAGLSPSPAPPSPQVHSVTVQNEVADLRLVIEKDPASGLFIYKTVDRRTGDVVQQLPREEVVRLHQAQDYTAGAVIKTDI